MATLPTSNDIFNFLEEATKEQCKLRLAIAGPSGSGKTYSGINLLMEMGCENVVVLDTEHRSASKYAGNFARKFKVIDAKYWQSNFDPRRLIAALRQLGPSCDGIVVDSLTHFWMGPGGMLDVIDQIALRQARGIPDKKNTFAAWKDGDKIYAELVQTILALPCHFVATLRAKSEFEDQEVNGRKKKVKVGMAAQVRDGFEYEFDVEGMMTMDHDFIVGKTRCSAIDGKVFNRPGKNMAEPLIAWLTEGVAPAEQKSTAFVAEEAAPETNRNPATEPAIPAVSATQVLLAKVTSAPSKDDLKAIANEIRASVKDKVITVEDYNGILSPAYAKRNKELEVAA